MAELNQEAEITTARAEKQAFARMSLAYVLTPYALMILAGILAFSPHPDFAWISGALVPFAALPQIITAWRRRK